MIIFIVSCIVGFIIGYNMGIRKNSQPQISGEKSMQVQISGDNSTQVQIKEIK